MATQKFVPKNKKSKKARRAENAAGRAKWDCDPRTKIVPSGKIYNRRKFKEGKE